MKKLLCCAISLVAMYVSVAQADPIAKDVIVTNDETSPVPVTIQNGVQTIVVWRYVGLTTFENDAAFLFVGLSGIAAMNAVCAAEFGPSARAATIAEAQFRTASTAGSAEARLGWLVPGGPMIPARTTTDLYRPLDAATGGGVGFTQVSPHVALSLAHCSRYTLNATSVGGSSVNRFGNQVVSSCNLILPVACSAPVAIPVAP